MAGQTTLKVTNRSGAEVKIYLTLGAVAGWKVGAPGPSAMPNCAPLLADLIAPSPAHLSSERFRLRGIEAELAFRLGTTLAPRTEA